MGKESYRYKYRTKKKKIHFRIITYRRKNCAIVFKVFP